MRGIGPLELRRRRGGTAPAHRLALLLAVAMMLAMWNDFPAWAEWFGLAVVLVLFLWPIAVWAYQRFWDGPRTFMLSYEENLYPVGAGDSVATLRLAARRPIELTFAKMALCDHTDGKARPKERRDVRIVELREAGSPDHIMEATRYSVARVELSFRDAPLLIGPEEPQYWSIRVASAKPWTGYLVFVGYDEDRRRRHSAIPIHISGEVRVWPDVTAKTPANP